MPISTIRCPHCDARVNYSIHSSKQLYSGDLEDQGILCPRCKNEFEITSSIISKRARNDLKELDDFESKMSSTSKKFDEVFKDDPEVVEHSLRDVDSVFAAAKDALSEISLDPIESSLDADQLLKQYSVPDVVVSTLKDKVKSAVEDKVPEQFVEPVSQIADTLLTTDEFGNYVHRRMSALF